MELFNINYSMKNMPTPSHQSYKLLLIDKIESVIKRMHWKGYFLMENKAAILEEPHKDSSNKLTDSSQNTIHANLNI